jgi:nuclear pore complex protein Nup98-Nup96
MSFGTEKFIAVKSKDETYEHISVMEQYKDKSPEELRLEDYRKKGILPGYPGPISTVPGLGAFTSTPGLQGTGSTTGYAGLNTGGGFSFGNTTGTGTTTTGSYGFGTTSGPTGIGTGGTNTFGSFGSTTTGTPGGFSALTSTGTTGTGTGGFSFTAPTTAGSGFTGSTATGTGTTPFSFAGLSTGTTNTGTGTFNFSTPAQPSTTTPGTSTGLFNPGITGTGLFNTGFPSTTATSTGLFNPGFPSTTTTSTGLFNPGFPTTTTTAPSTLFPSTTTQPGWNFTNIQPPQPQTIEASISTANAYGKLPTLPKVEPPPTPINLSHYSPLVSVGTPRVASKETLNRDTPRLGFGGRPRAPSLPTYFPTTKPEEPLTGLVPGRVKKLIIDQSQDPEQSPLFNRENRDKILKGTPFKEKPKETVLTPQRIPPDQLDDLPPTLTHHALISDFSIPSDTLIPSSSHYLESMPYFSGVKRESSEPEIPPKSTIPQNNNKNDGSSGNHHNDGLPKLTKEGYYTIPSLKDMKMMTKEQLRSIPKFTIGCKDKGKITFETPTNVLNLNIDDIVQINTRIIEVYPNDANKPPEGKELNKPAILTIYGCWPKDKQSGDYKRDSQSCQKYEKVLRSKCRKMDVDFVSYRHEDGAWVFRVNGF